MIFNAVAYSFFIIVRGIESCQDLVSRMVPSFLNQILLNSQPNIVPLLLYIFSPTHSTLHPSTYSPTHTHMHPFARRPHTHPPTHTHPSTHFHIHIHPSSTPTGRLPLLWRRASAAHRAAARRHQRDARLSPPHRARRHARIRALGAGGRAEIRRVCRAKVGARAASAASAVASARCVERSHGRRGRG
jgi:hypothetical protein